MERDRDVGSMADIVGVVVGQSKRAKLDIMLEYDENVDGVWEGAALEDANMLAKTPAELEGVLFVTGVGMHVTFEDGGETPIGFSETSDTFK